MTIASDEHLHDVAREIGKRQRDREVRIVFVTSLITLAVILLFGLISLRILLNQTEATSDSINEARIAQAREQEQLERILDDIDERMVPRSDIIQLQAQVEALQDDVTQLSQTNRQLTRAVNNLTEQVAALSRSVRRAGGG